MIDDEVEFRDVKVGMVLRSKRFETIVRVDKLQEAYKTYPAVWHTTVIKGGPGMRGLEGSNYYLGEHVWQYHHYVVHKGEVKPVRPRLSKRPRLNK